ncbi:MAG: hypothetical protein EXR83_04670 [Gammaproteobacteria bacterium]|nr:hypothetical protein [Gammaproteobacteria bacterium]
MRASIFVAEGEVMDVLTQVRHLPRHGIQRGFIARAGQLVQLQLSGNVALDLRAELNALGEELS